MNTFIKFIGRDDNSPIRINSQHIVTFDERIHKDKLGLGIAVANDRGFAVLDTKEYLLSVLEKTGIKVLKLTGSKNGNSIWFVVDRISSFIEVNNKKVIVYTEEDDYPTSVNETMEEIDALIEAL